MTETTGTLPRPQGAHLVGSINLPDAETVFRTVAGHLGPQVRRIPDGEVGERYYWIQFQTFRFDETPGLERVGDEGYLIRGQFDTRPFRLADGAEPGGLRFPPLGYADAAIESYAAFRSLKDAGVIPSGVRFQVSLPTPAGVVGAFVVAEDRAAIEPVYEAALVKELERIVDAIPHAELAIQWDNAVEFGFLERAEVAGAPLTAWWDDVLAGVVERAVRLAARVPDDVAVGYHLCYGDVEEAHFHEPSDAGTLAAVLQALFAAASRPISWVHLPVPIARDDDAYFAPLASVDWPEDTEVYLGLVHHEDGIEGASRRIETALKHVPRFGVATECGFGRGPAERTVPLLEIHAAVTAPWPR